MRVQRILLLTVLSILLGSPLVAAAGSLSGSTSVWIELDPIAGAFNALDLGFAATYEVGDIAVSTDGLFVLPGTWIWQEFSAVGRFGAYALETNVLFGPSTTDYLYAEAIVEFSIAGIATSWHVAQLSDAVLGGPADGWAVRIAGSVSGFDLISVSEFGARIEDEEFDGITIVHAATGEERHYATDPLVSGQGFTGQKVSLRRLDFCRADLVNATVYFTCDGLQYVSFAATGIRPGLLPWLTFDADVTFELDEKSLSLAPSLSLGAFACMGLYGELDWDAVTRSIGGISFYGIELVCQLGPVTVRDVAVFDLNHYAITTEAYGSVIERLVDVIDAGHDVYPDYWELLSIAYRGDGCCGGELTFLANAYFDETSASLFDWAMSHIEAEIPLAEAFSFTLGMEMHPAAIDSVTFGFQLTW